MVAMSLEEKVFFYWSKIKLIIKGNKPVFFPPSLVRLPRSGMTQYLYPSAAKHNQRKYLAQFFPCSQIIKVIRFLLKPIINKQKNLRFCSRGAIFIFNSTIIKHFRHSNGPAGKVRIIVQSFSNLHYYQKDNVIQNFPIKHNILES